MGFIFNIIKALTNSSHPAVYTIGPNNLAELLKQFDEPVKQKTQEDIIKDFKIQQNMITLEVEMLSMDAPKTYLGTQTWYEGAKKCFDFVPCVVRPEVVYCSYGKN